MAALSIQQIGEAGLDPQFSAAAAGGDTFANDTLERTFLFVKNGGAGAITVTGTAQKTQAGVRGFGALPRNDIAVSVPAGQDRLIGPFTDAFSDAAGNVSVTYSGVTSVTVAAVRLPRLS